MSKKELSVSATFLLYNFSPVSFFFTVQPSFGFMTRKWDKAAWEERLMAYVCVLCFAKLEFWILLFFVVFPLSVSLDLLGVFSKKKNRRLWPSWNKTKRMQMSYKGHNSVSPHKRRHKSSGNGASKTTVMTRTFMTFGSALSIVLFFKCSFILQLVSTRDKTSRMLCLQDLLMIL